MINLPFREIWACDFEYRAPAGEHPQPVCMCARDLRSGREIRLWRNDFRRCAAPFDTGPDSVLVAYAAAAELSCFLELGWPLPTNVIDLFAEHRVATNGIPLACGNGLLRALAIHGLAHIDAGEKEEMRHLVLGQTDYSDAERAAILTYCMSDVDALAALLPTLPIELPFALLRGRYGAAVARMERAGIPIGVELYSRVVENWEALKRDLIDEVNVVFDVYDDGHFRLARFEKWLTAHRIANWPRTETGLLALDGDTFDEQIALHPELPELRLLRELRATLSRMRLIGLEIGADGRNRTALRPFQAITGRNLPSASKFIFGPSRWLRGFIKPPQSFGLAYLDFKAEEVAIAAALAGDARLADHYATGDVYWRFAVTTGLGAPAATGLARKAIRDLVKVLFLAISYGMQALSLARCDVACLQGPFFRFFGPLVGPRPAVCSLRAKRPLGTSQRHVPPDESPKGALMSALWSVEYQRKDSDTKECLLVSVAEPKSTARSDLKAVRVDAQRLARARLEHKVGKVVILSCRCIGRDLSLL